jgi:probable blue pigment (indigoidine) exporter
MPTSPSPNPGRVSRSSTADSGRLDLLFVVFLGILWGSAFPVIRAGIVAGAPPLLFAASRYLVTAIALVPIAALTGAPRPSPSHLASPAIFGGLIMIGVYGGLLYIGEETTSGGLAAVLTASAPLLSALIGYRALPAERFGRGGVVGLIVGFVGVSTLVLPSLSQGTTGGFTGPLFVVAAVVAFATGSVLLRTTSKAAPGFWLLSIQFAVAGTLLAVVALAAGETISLGNPAVTLPALAFLVVVPGILGYTLYFRIHHTSGPARANLVGYVNPATGVLVGLFVFGEEVPPIELAGLALIAMGLFVLQQDRRRMGRSALSKEGGTAVDPSPGSAPESK